MSSLSKYWRKFEKWIKKTLKNDLFTLDDMVLDLSQLIYELVHSNIKAGHKPTRGLTQLLKNWFSDVVRS